MDAQRILTFYSEKFTNVEMGFTVSQLFQLECLLSYMQVEIIKLKLTLLVLDCKAFGCTFIITPIKAKHTFKQRKNKNVFSCIQIQSTLLPATCFLETGEWESSFLNHYRRFWLRRFMDFLLRNSSRASSRWSETRLAEQVRQIRRGSLRVTRLV